MNKDFETARSEKRQALIEAKWRPIVSGGTIKMSTKRQGLASQAMEQQQRYLREECCAINGFNTGQIAAYEKQAVGMLKRVYHRLISPDIVGTQPMPGPVSLAIFFRHRYSGGPAGQNDILEPGGRNRIWRNGIDSDRNAVEFDPYYSLLEANDLATLTTPNFTGLLDPAIGETAVGEASMSDFRVVCSGVDLSDPNGPGNLAVNALIPGSEIITLSGDIQLGTLPPLMLPFPATTEFGLAGPLLSDPLAPVQVAQWKDCVSGDTVTLTVEYVISAAGATTALDFTLTVLDGGGNTATADLDILFVRGAVFQTGMLLNENCGTSQTNGACPDGYGVQNQFENVPARDIGFEICKVAFQPVTRKLRTNWSLEAVQDLKNLYNMDAERELTDIASAEIASEIDREIIGDLMAYARHRAVWFSKPPVYTTGVFPALHMTPTEWYQTLMHVVTDISMAIYKATRRAKANWIVADTFSASFFEKMNEFVADVDLDMADVGVAKVGTLANKYKVYVDPLMPKGKILVGYKGTSEYDTGYIYAPYQPLTMTPVVWDECTFRAFKGIYTRYGKVMTLDGTAYYGVIDVVDACDTSFLCAAC